MDETQNQERLLALVLFSRDNDNHLQEVDEFDEFLDDKILKNILDMPLAEMNLNARCYDRRMYDDLYDEQLVEGHQSQPMETIIEVILFIIPVHGHRMIKTMIQAGADVDDSLDEYRVYGLLEDIKPGAGDIFGFDTLDALYMLNYIVEARTIPFSQNIFEGILGVYYYMLRRVNFVDRRQEPHFLLHSITQKMLSIGNHIPAKFYEHPNSDFWRLYLKSGQYWGLVMVGLCLERKGLTPSLL